LNDPNDPRATAYHEAGHIVVARVLGRRVLGATLRKEGDSNARASLTDVRPNQRKRRETDLVVAFAGLYAERKFLGRDPHPLSALDDMTYIAEEIADLMRNPRTTRTEEEWKSELADRAKTIVDRNWAAVAMVAEALFENEYLSEGQLRRLLKDTPFVR